MVCQAESIVEIKKTKENGESENDDREKIKTSTVISCQIDNSRYRYEIGWQGKNG